MQLLSRLKRRLNKTQGFTLIEMLVVAPIAVITIATLISLMVALVGDVAVSRERSVSAYSVQTALDRIEQDARIATTYMPSFSIVTSPQGRDGGTNPFNTASGDIIMSQYATTASPYDANRQIVYYADQPNPCSGSYTLNRPLTVRVIYFTKGTAGNLTLWRRVIVPTNSTTATDTTKVCAQPWQRDNCPAPVTISSVCQAEDEKILDNVSSFTTTYYTSTGATTTDARSADSLKVSLTQSVQIAGETVATSGVARGSHINVTTDNIPVAPTISVYNPSINTYNNPVLTTFAWDAIPNAAVYSVRYKINSGAWQNQPDQVSTQFQVDDARPRDTITIAVAAKNDMGNSTETSYTYSTPLWTTANLEGDWDCYQPSQTTWSCPAYTLLTSDVMVVRGLASGGSGTIFTLPINLRPKKTLVYSTLAQGGAANSASARVDISSGGAVLYQGGGTNSWVSLDSLRYIRSNSSLTWTLPTFSNTWADYGGGTTGYGKVEYTKDSMGRTHLSGLLDVGTNTAGLTIHSLAANYNERGGLGIFPSLNSGNVFSAFQVNSGAVVARGKGSNWMSETVLYPSASSGASFVSVAAQAGWTNYGGAYAPATYSKTSDGLVVIQGLIVPTTVAQNTVLFTLPVGYRPGKQMLFGVADSGSGTYAGQEIARLDVETNGQVSIVYNVTSGTWLSLEGMNFYQEN